MSDFDPDMSQFGVDVKGNMWVERPEDGAINGTAFGGSGNNDVAGRAGEPYLTLKLPEEIEDAEAMGEVYQAVQPAGKSATTLGELKSAY